MPLYHNISIFYMILWNIKELRSPNKKITILHHLKCLHPQVVFLQKTYLKIEDFLSMAKVLDHFVRGWLEYSVNPQERQKEWDKERCIGTYKIEWLGAPNIFKTDGPEGQMEEVAPRGQRVFSFLTCPSVMVQDWLLTDDAFHVPQTGWCANIAQGNFWPCANLCLFLGTSIWGGSDFEWRFSTNLTKSETIIKLM